MGLYTRIIDLQKLRAAWGKMRKNHATAGVDRVTSEQFDANSDEELKKLKRELETHTYETLPVRMVTIYKEKAREIALYSMRDKVVQQSIAAELVSMYEKEFNSCVYSYREHRSALEAVETIDHAIATGQYSDILKTDIRHFFDEIDWKHLCAILQRRIREEDVLDLIRQNCCGPCLDVQNGDVEDKAVGIYQGSGISPILSNIYLMEFDAWMQEQVECYVRYADDILILETDRNRMLKLLHEMDLHLQKLGLHRNEKKTVCASLEEGVDFLGYHFNSSGKSIPVKAEEGLQNRLEAIWISGSETELQEKIKKVLEVTGGWEQYYRGEREPGSIYEYVCLLYGIRDRKESYELLRDSRKKLENICKDIMLYLAEFWKKHADPLMELMEYEQFYQLPESKLKEDCKSLQELLSCYRSHAVAESTETVTEIIQLYTDLQQYEVASKWNERLQLLKKTNQWSEPAVLSSAEDTAIGFRFDEETAAKLLHTFAGREDIYSEEGIGYGGKRRNEVRMLPLTQKQLKEHLQGNHTYGTFIQRPNGTARFVVIDIDISRKVLLQYERGSEQFLAYMQKARDTAHQVCQILHNMGLKGYTEYSGNRGYHVWLLLTEWVQVRYLNMLCDTLESKIRAQENITVEFYPNKTRVKADKFGQTMKIPYGIHVKTGERSVFYREDGTPAGDVNAFLDGLAKFSAASVKKVIAGNFRQPVKCAVQEVDRDLSVFGEIDSSSEEVLSKCSLLRYLCQKAVKTGYLSHFERLTILYVFGHMGENGQRFIHKVMSFTLNYSYRTTERFIRKCPEKPISCMKLREQYKRVTAEIGCNCVFRQKKNCYPSPVMHAIVRNSGMETEITIPTSRALSGEKKQRALDEMNIYKQAEELARQMQDMNRKKRELERKIRQTEKELSSVFDSVGVESLELEMGLLTRRKGAMGEEWVIEI